MSKILLVEDVAEYHTVVKKALAPHEVHGVYSIDEAISYLSQYPVDLIVLDLGFPEKNGYTLMSELQSRRDYTPIICLTGLDGIESKVAAFSLGAEDYVLKPFHPIEFKARVEAKLKKYSQVLLGVFKLGKIQVDLQNHMVFGHNRDGSLQEIPLTMTEYRLLCLLGRNPDRVFSRSQLLKSIWGDQVEVVERVVDVHIHGLRKKIEKYADFIKAVPGVGYKITGARGAKVEEPLAWPVLEPIQWREPKFDLGELARLRFIHGYDQQDLARHFGKSVYSIQNYYVALRSADLSKVGLTDKEQEIIRCRLLSKK